MNRKLLFAFMMLCITVTLSAQQWGAYTLIAPQTKVATLVDTLGATYHTWNFSTTTGYSSYLLPGGTILRTVATSGNSISGGGTTGGLQKVDWNGNALWTITYSSSTYVLHHDICPLPNGNILAIAYDVKTAAEATAAGCSSAKSIQSEKIIEFQPVGTTGYNIVWEWKVWDHLCQNYSSSKNNYVTSIVDNPQLMNVNYLSQTDWLHMNGVDYNPYLDQITFSSHNWNSIFVIDHSTTTAEAASHKGGNSGKGGDILYRWGNPASYGASGTTNFNVIHDAHWVTPECPYANCLVGFNNKGGTGSKSTFDIVTPPYDGYNYSTTNGVYGPSTYTYRYTATSSTQSEGGSQQLPNGNSMMTLALSGNIYEVNSSGVVLWSKLGVGKLSKAYRYSKCYVDGTQPATPTVSESDGVLISSVYGSSYQWYKNNYKIVGANNRTYTPGESAKYAVQIVEGNDCLSSISDAITFSISTAVNYINNSQVKFYPNPCKDVLNIDGCADIKNAQLVIYSLAGKQLDIQSVSNSYSVTNLPNGVYVACLKSGNDIISRQKLTIIK